MNDTIIFLVLAGIALLFKWLTGQASGDSKKPESPSPDDRTQPPPQQDPSADSDTERIRRFLEALGAPPGTQPPPPVRPRRVVTPAPRTPPPKAKPNWAQPLPPLTTAPPEPVVFEVTPPPPVAAVPPPPEPAPSLPPPTPSSRKTAPPRLMPVASLGAMLRSARTARQAIVLREILGPPRGLQALDDLRSF